MKKLFTSLTLLGAAVFGVSAQNFTVTGLGDATFADGDVVNVGYTPSAIPGRYNWDPELEVHVNHATSAITGKSTFTVSVSANVDGKVQFCGIDGQCQIIGATGVTKSGSYSAGNVIPLIIDIANERQLPAEPYVVNVSVSDGVETVNFTVNFTSEAGLATPEVADSRIRVSGRTLHYTVDATDNLTLYNISGRSVISRSVSGTGSINLRGVPAGIYVYRLGTLTGKLLVR